MIPGIGGEDVCLSSVLHSRELELAEEPVPGQLSIIIK